MKKAFKPKAKAKGSSPAADKDDKKKGKNPFQKAAEQASGKR